MNSEQLLNIVKTDPCLNLRVKGVYASNTLPRFVTQYPSAFIINTQPLPLPGEHWIAIIVHSPLRAEFFDSLGHTPADYNQDIQNFLDKNSKRCYYKATRLQPRNSDLCGLYVLVFLIAKLCFKYSLNRVYALFSSNNIQSNDVFVRSFMHNYLTH